MQYVIGFTCATSCTTEKHNGQPLKLISWNVNGIRAVEKKGFIDIVKDLNPDILAIQEFYNSSKIDFKYPYKYRTPEGKAQLVQALGDSGNRALEGVNGLIVKQLLVWVVSL